MIIQPFTIGDYTFVDQRAIDSSTVRTAVQQAILSRLQDSQQDAMCAAIRIPELGNLPNFGFGVFEGSKVVGAYLSAANEYVSGPWRDLVDWEVIGDDPIVTIGRHMPAFAGLSERNERRLSVEACLRCLNGGLTTVNGHTMGWSRVSWAIFKKRTDPASLRDLALNQAAVSDRRIRATEVPDVNNPELTRVDVELA